MTPKEAIVVKNGKTLRKPVSEIFPEDILLIRAGELIPVDAVITIGIASVDESSITGEPIPITVLIVGCPCALILAAPTAVVAAISRAARRGVLIKGGRFIENVAYADVILFDKTGTLTMGEPIVEEIIPVLGIDKDHVLRQAACVEQNSTHPLAKAVLNAAKNANITLDSAENLFTEIGRGIRGCVAGCQVQVGNILISDNSNTFPEFLKKEHERILAGGATPLLVYQDNVAIGLIAVSDPVRPDAKKNDRVLGF